VKKAAVDKTDVKTEGEAKKPKAVKKAAPKTVRPKKKAE
jgi:hypothetical protein